ARQRSGLQAVLGRIESSEAWFGRLLAFRHGAKKKSSTGGAQCVETHTGTTARLLRNGRSQAIPSPSDGRPPAGLVPTLSTCPSCFSTAAVVRCWGAVACLRW